MWTENFMRIQMFYFNTLGFFLDPKYKSRANAFQLLQIAVLLFGLMAQCTHFMRNLEYTFALAENIGRMMSLINSLSKFLVVYTFKDNFMDIRERIKSMSRKLLNDDEKKTLESVNKFEQKISIAFLVPPLLLLAITSVTPMLRSYYSSFKYGKFTYNMPLDSAAFPYDITKTPVYELTYLAVAIFCYTITIVSVSSNHLVLIFRAKFFLYTLGGS